MKAEDLLNKLAEFGLPVFTTSDVSGIIGKEAIYTKNFLALLVKRKCIEKIERGKYCIIGTNPYIIASRLAKGSYVALLSAARFHNITTQMPSEITVFTARNHRSAKIKGNYSIKFVRVNKKILYGFREYNGAYVSEIEKIFVDDIYYHKSLFYTEELETAAKKGILDRKRLKRYATETKNKWIIRAVNSALANLQI
jgi:predicted transcriptional regulator of viral defense system